ncbi:MAG: hypothetical protein ACO3JZ_02775 [Schleiferiaceae bacterium]|jgi:hypothetical protein|nr:MAG: hypothetical protein C7N14_03945 [Bacteroidota bacterium]
MKHVIILSSLIFMASCASPNRSIYDTANSMYGSSWTYLGTITVYPDVIYSDTIKAAEQTREVVLHDGLISYEKMMYEAKKAYGDSVTIANIRIYSEEFKTKWFGRNSDVQALVDVIYVTK